MTPRRARQAAAVFAAVALLAALVARERAAGAPPRAPLDGGALAAWRGITGNPPRYDIVLLTTREARV